MNDGMRVNEAIEDSLRLWEYLRDNPDVTSMDNLPPEILTKGYRNNSPICDFFMDRQDCPLGKCMDEHSAYVIWLKSQNRSTRAAACEVIIDDIKKWREKSLF